MDTQPFLPNNEDQKNYQTTTPTYITLPNGQVQMLVTLPSSSPLSPLSPPSAHSPLSSYPFTNPQQLYPTHPSAYQVTPPHGYSPAVSSSPSSSCSSSSYKCQKIAMLITHITGLFFFIPHFVSIILSLHLLRRGQIAKRATATILLSVLELIAFTVCLSLSWYFKSNCEGILHFNNNWYYYPLLKGCHVTYYGWIAIVIWLVIAVVFGIPRVICTWKGNNENDNDNKNSNENNNNNSINNKDTTVPLAFQGYQSNYTRASTGMRATILTSFIVGLFFFVPSLLSAILSLLLLRRGVVIKESFWIVVCSVLEIFTWTIGASLSWFPFVTQCQYSCEQVWVGWIFLMPWWIVSLTFGIPRVILSWKN